MAWARSFFVIDIRYFIRLKDCKLMVNENYFLDRCIEYLGFCRNPYRQVRNKKSVGRIAVCNEVLRRTCIHKTIAHTVWTLSLFLNALKILSFRCKNLANANILKRRNYQLYNNTQK